MTDWHKQAMRVAFVLSQRAGWIFAIYRDGFVQLGTAVALNVPLPDNDNQEN